MFEPKDRLIFRFHDGKQERFADPLTVYKKLAVCCDYELQKFLVAYSTNTQNKEGIEATDKLVAAVRQAFGVPAYDGKEGLLEDECMALLYDYYEWMNDVK